MKASTILAVLASAVLSNASPVAGGYESAPPVSSYGADSENQCLAFYIRVLNLIRRASTSNELPTPRLPRLGTTTKLDTTTNLDTTKARFRPKGGFRRLLRVDCQLVLRQ